MFLFWVLCATQAHTFTPAALSPARLAAPPLSLRLEAEDPSWNRPPRQETAPLRLEPPIGIFCGGDPVNYFDPDGRCARDYYQQNGSTDSQMLRGIGQSLDNYASTTQSPMGAGAAFLGYFANLGANAGTPSTYVNQAASDYSAQGGGTLGILGVANRYNPTTGFYSAASGIDAINGNQLSTVQQWSSGLGAGGSTLLLGVGGLSGLSLTADTTIANPVPTTLARVIPGEGPFPTLGLPSASDVFVTDPAAIQGMTPTQISLRLGLNLQTLTPSSNSRRHPAVWRRRCFAPILAS